MPLAQTKSLYRRTLRERVLIRRYTGTGPGRTSVDVSCRAKIIGDSSGVLVGDVRQFEFDAVVLAEDLATGGIALPLTPADKLVLQGREMAIMFPDNATRSDEGVLVAYQIKAKG
jgi:hypothetical protein